MPTSFGFIVGAVRLNAIARFTLLFLIAVSVVFWSLSRPDLPLLSLPIETWTKDFSCDVSVVKSAFYHFIRSLIAVVWVRLANAGREPSAPVKFVMDFLVGLGFLVLVVGAKFADENGPDS